MRILRNAICASPQAVSSIPKMANQEKKKSAPVLTFVLKIKLPVLGPIEKPPGLR